MRGVKYFIIVMSLLMLNACGRSKEPFYYVMNPVYLKLQGKEASPRARIGIDIINIPEYLEKTQLSIYCTANQSKLNEDHQWAENPNANIKRVIKTNLTNFLPGAMVEVYPWDSKFDPDYHVQVDISQFKVDITGHSILYADFTIYDPDKTVTQYHVRYQQKIPVVNPLTVVQSMNANLTHLTRDMAKAWSNGRH